MTDCVFADELKDFLMQLFLNDNTDEMEEWPRRISMIATAG
jgi:hypothetical protein